MTSLLAIAALSVWTNVTGNVISAAPVRIDGRNVVLREGTRELRLPLTAFPACEQRRLRLALGAYELPQKAAAVRTILAADLARAEARAKAGRMSAEELAAKRTRTAAAWAHELEKDRHGLSPKEIEYWKGKIGK